MTTWKPIDDVLEQAGGIFDGEPRTEREQWLARQKGEPTTRLPKGRHSKRKGHRETACRARGHDWSDPANVGVKKTGRRYCKACQREKRRERAA